MAEEQTRTALESIDYINRLEQGITQRDNLIKEQTKLIKMQEVLLARLREYMGEENFLYICEEILPRKELVGTEEKRKD